MAAVAAGEATGWDGAALGLGDVAVALWLTAAVAAGWDAGVLSDADGLGLGEAAGALWLDAATTSGCDVAVLWADDEPALGEAVGAVLWLAAAAVSDGDVPVL